MATSSPANRTVPTVSELGPRQGLAALKAMRSGFAGILPILTMVRAELGDVFQLTIPGFRPVFVAHPDAIRQILVDKRHAFLWRPEGDPVARLLRRGMLVTDGEEHARLREIMEPSAQRKHFAPKADLIRHETDRVLSMWRPGERYDMLDEMRKLALLVFERIYFSHDLLPELDDIWDPILKTLEYISPGLWILRPNGAGPPPSETDRLDAHLYQLIRARRAAHNPPDDLLTHLVQALDDDDLVRDQMMTMLIAGHDTSTAQLAWTLYLLGAHPDWMDRVQTEIRETLGSALPTPDNTRSLPALDQVIKESLRLYPPIHVGSRSASQDVELMGYTIPAGTRLMYSIYLVQRHPSFWDNPDDFQPERFAGAYQTRVTPFTYLPFGGGPRNCIGGAFAQLEARIALTRMLQVNDLTLLQTKVKANMGATLEPRPNVLMQLDKQAPMEPIS